MPFFASIAHAWFSPETIHSRVLVGVIALAIPLSTCPAAAAPLAPSEAPPAKASPPVDATVVSSREASAPKAQPGGVWGPRFGRRHWEMGLLLDYSQATGPVSGLELEPNTLGLNLSASYLFSGGLRLGIVGDIYKGKSISQIYEPPLSAGEIPLDARSQLGNVGLLVGYDHPLGPIVLRYSVATNLGIVAWNLGTLPYDSVGGFTAQGTEFAFNIDSAMGVVWPIDFFFLNAQIHYRIPLSSYLASALGGGLGMGVQF